MRYQRRSQGERLPACTDPGVLESILEAKRSDFRIEIRNTIKPTINAQRAGHYGSGPPLRSGFNQQSELAQ